MGRATHVGDHEAVLGARDSMIQQRDCILSVSCSAFQINHFLRGRGLDWALQQEHWSSRAPCSPSLGTVARRSMTAVHSRLLLPPGTRHHPGDTCVAAGKPPTSNCKPLSTTTKRGTQTLSRGTKDTPGSLTARRHHSPWDAREHGQRSPAHAAFPLPFDTASL